MRRLVSLVCLALFVVGCHTDMWEQPQTRTFEPSEVFADGQSARPPVPGTLAYTDSPASELFATGLAAGQPLEVVPMTETATALGFSGDPETVRRAVLERGQVRFDVFCSPCHGRLGDGKGMIAQRGLTLVRQPRNLHDDRILHAPDGHIFRVITHGFGAMYSYGDRIPAADRWAIVAYVRALELSEGGRFAP